MAKWPQHVEQTCLQLKAFSLPRRGNKRLGDVAIMVGGKQTLVTLSGMVIGWGVALTRDLTR